MVITEIEAAIFGEACWRSKAQNHTRQMKAAGQLFPAATCDFDNM